MLTLSFFIQIPSFLMWSIVLNVVSSFDVVSSYYLVSSLCSISMDTKKVGTDLCQAGAGLSFAFYPVKLDF